MHATIFPEQLQGTVSAIASKSVAHRAIIAAALANGKTDVICNTSCEDIEATRRCLVALGARIESTPFGFEVFPLPKTTSAGILAARKHATLDCGESGSTLRFLLPICGALSADACLTGSGRLQERPLTPLVDELYAAGMTFKGLGTLPLETQGRLRAGAFQLPGNVSSQFITGLLLAAPLLDAPISIEVRGVIESEPYVRLTVQILKQFGVEVDIQRADAKSTIPLAIYQPRGSYRTPGSLTVEGDWSAAGFWLAAAAMGTHTITVRGLRQNSVQGDRNILAVLSRFGAKIERSADAVRVSPDTLSGFEMNAADIPDLIPVIAAVASLASGTTRIRNCARLRLKESDRLHTIASELGCLGADIHIEGDDLVICGVDMLKGGEVYAHGDHRIAMMAAITAQRSSAPVIIHGADAVAKSYPDFFEHYRALHGRIALDDSKDSSTEECSCHLV